MKVARAIPFLAALAIGCTTLPRAEFDLPATRIVCADTREITADYNAILARWGKTNDYQIRGFQHFDTIYVMWSLDTDKNGDPLPDFETLGHEVWHRIRGRWHD